MLLSIIIPVYNGEKYLARCFDSLFNQDLDHRDYEVIVVNDGSSDSSLDIVNIYKSKYENLKIISQENQGQSAARNIGIREAKGEYLFFVDSDDYIAPLVLKNLINIAVISQLDFLGFSMTNTSSSNYKSIVDFSKFNPDDIQVYDGLSYISNFNYYNTVWWYLFRRDILVITNLLFEEGKIIEDGIFTTELLLNCKRASYLDLNIYRYFINEDSIMHNKSKSHLAKISEDFKFIVHKFTNLIKLADRKGADSNAIKRLRARQESYVFFLFIRLLKDNVSFKEIKQFILEMDSINVYPLNNFIGLDYNSIKLKILTTIFNHKTLLFFFMKLNSCLKIIK
ncbi:glycosyltransferase [Ancylomarina sp. 16SWW S1-10-2]|uniref:glycosyltransferase n=1 Tax=Ancylomarina sp. 16SWW S1-10-2 TaxID=2499681 RepID=UPI0012AEA8C9|nr:glycosyltransferase [Ancylomarina sp. 16SWW S1-10-2]MRT93419.1 glycosyltransferase [Ancylomarina sp. 16SWW S1-10-2]